MTTIYQIRISVFISLFCRQLLCGITFTHSFIVSITITLQTLKKLLILQQISRI